MVNSPKGHGDTVTWASGILTDVSESLTGLFRYHNGFTGKTQGGVVQGKSLGQGQIAENKNSTLKEGRN